MVIHSSNLGNISGLNSKIDFRVHVAPAELDGIEVVWKML